MSLTSLVAAARSAVHLSELAATAAEEVTEAAKLASIHAKAALAASVKYRICLKVMHI